MEKYDVVVIGGGSGGLVLASGAAQLGLKTMMIEKSRLGGDCLWTGCVPSKTLLRSAKVARMAAKSKQFGLTVNKLSASIPRVMDHVKDVQSIIQVHDSPRRFRSLGVDVVFGSPTFTSRKVVKVGARFIKSRYFVISTGSHAFVPPIEGLQETGFLTNENVFLLKRNIKSLIIVGGGPIGSEMAQAFTRLGVKVTMIERGDHILGREDAEMAQVLERKFKEEGIEIVHNASVVKLSKNRKLKRVTVEMGGKRKEFAADEVLVSVGRRPNVKGLNLEAAKVKYSDRGIEVDKRLRTSQKHIFAVGDVIGKYQFTHVAEYHAGIALANIAFKFPKKVSERVIPWVTFTDPEFARVGMIPAEAEKQGIRHKAFTLQLKDVDRAVCDSEPDGMIKLVVSPKGRVLGVSILGENAGEYLHEFVLVMQNNLSLKAISNTIHVYPTLAQAVRRAANMYYGEKLFSPGVKRLVRWLKRL